MHATSFEIHVVNIQSMEILKRNGPEEWFFNGSSVEVVKTEPRNF